MVCLFLLPVIAKIPTDYLILIGCWKVSLNLISCLKRLSRKTKCSTSLDLGNCGLYAGAYKKFVPFFWTHFISWQSVAWFKNIVLLSLLMPWRSQWARRFSIQANWRNGDGIAQTKKYKKIHHDTIRKRFNLNGSAILHVICAPMSLNSLYLASGPGAQKF